MKIEIRKASVTSADTEIIVNAANRNLAVGCGVCGAIFESAGLENLQKECAKIGFCQTGEAVITSGFKLSKYIIHAVGPHYYLDPNPFRLLESTYLNALVLADKTKAKSIAFPCISTGIYSFPLREATEIALQTILGFKAENLERCVLCCFTQEEYDTYLKTLNNLQKTR